jgi:hypothetical protein
MLMCHAATSFVVCARSSDYDILCSSFVEVDEWGARMDSMIVVDAGLDLLGGVDTACNHS